MKIDDELIQHHQDNPDHNENLNELSGRLEQLSLASNNVCALLDQLGGRLNTWYETLQKGGDFVENTDLPVEKAKRLDDQINGVLHQLDLSLDHVDKLWNRINYIWTVVIDSSHNPESSPRLGEVLSKLEVVFSYAKLIDALKLFLSELESNPDHLVPHYDRLLINLAMPMSRFNIALSKLDNTLRGIQNDLFSLSEASLHEMYVV